MDNTIKPRIERRIIVKVIVPYLYGEIAFAYPSGSGSYKNVGKEILARKQRVPHGDYTASLMHAVYCCSEFKNEPEFEDIRNLMNKRGFWIYNQNLWTDKGVYVVQDTQAQGRDKHFHFKKLERMLKGAKEIDSVRFSAEGSVRFAPKETYKSGEHTCTSFVQDGFVRATVGIAGAEKLAEVSEKFKNNPRTRSLFINEGDFPGENTVQRASILLISHGGLELDGDQVGGGYSPAFGVLESNTLSMHLIF